MSHFLRFDFTPDTIYFKGIIRRDMTFQRKNTWQAAYCFLCEGFLYIWKDPEQYRKARHMISQTNAKFCSSIDLSALLLDVNLSGCLCDVAYSSKRNNVFKIIDEKTEVLIEANRIVLNLTLTIILKIEVQKGNYNTSRGALYNTQHSLFWARHAPL